MTIQRLGSLAISRAQPFVAGRRRAPKTTQHHLDGFLGRDLRPEILGHGHAPSWPDSRRAGEPPRFYLIVVSRHCRNQFAKPVGGLRRAVPDQDRAGDGKLPADAGPDRLGDVLSTAMKSAPSISWGGPSGCSADEFCGQLPRFEEHAGLSDAERNRELQRGRDQQSFDAGLQNFTAPLLDHPQSGGLVDVRRPAERAEAEMRIDVV